MTFNRRVQRLLERLTGCDIQRYGPKTFSIVERKNRTDAWFSLREQTRVLLDKFRVDLVVDVGANEGQFVRELRPLYGGEILSFEPVPVAFEKLARAASSDPNWRVFPLALGDRETTRTLRIADDTRFSSFLETSEFCRRHFGDRARGTREETLRIRRLDGFLDETVPDIGNRRILLKLDTQGFDLDVFRGSAGRIENVVALQSEVSLAPLYEGMPHWTTSIATYEEAGFAVVGLFPVVRDSGRVLEYDCLMERIGP